MNMKEKLAQAVELHRLGQLDEASQLYHSILESYPDEVDTLHLLGALYISKKEFDQAKSYLEQSLNINPKQIQALYNLGNLHYLTADLFRAAEFYERVLEINPSYSWALNNYGTVLSELGRKDEAIQILSKAILNDPKNAQAHKNMGQLLRYKGRYDEALVFLGEAVSLDESYGDAYEELSNVLSDLGFKEEAINSLEKSVQAKPDSEALHIRLGDLYTKAGLLQDAVDIYSKGLELNPENPVIHNNLGLVYLRQGRISEAITSHRQAFWQKPDKSMYHSNLLLTLNYLEGIDKKAVYNIHLDWERIQTKGIIPYENNHISLSERIKIGYVSPDFRKHSVSYFVEPLLAHHNTTSFEVFCFSDLEKEDDISEQLKSVAEHWIPIWDKSDFELTQLIADNEIDILVDLAGHTGNNRLKVFALKPAPIQVSWLGYPNTTGLSSIDYRFTDQIADLPGEDDYYSEELVRLQNGFLCFNPITETPPVQDLPAIHNEYITFGSFNNLGKLNYQVIELWASILKRVPNSKILLKSIFMDDERTKEQIIQKFRDCQVKDDRIIILSRSPTRYEHLDAYNQMDIGLDPFPYCGTTTTFEALWMGVPVITLQGDRHAGRVGTSILTHLELEQLVAKSKQEYVNIAQKLAQNKQNLVQFRLTLRDLLKTSKLMDGSCFADQVEQFYKQAWNHHNEYDYAENIIIG